MVELSVEKKMGKGFKIIDGDVVVDSGGIIQQVESSDNAVQGLQTLLLTQLGEDIIHPGVGLDFLSLVEIFHQTPEASKIYSHFPQYKCNRSS